MKVSKVSLETILEQSGGKKLLFLGRESLFTHQEIERFLKPYDITLTKSLDEDVVAVVEHHRLNPVEEDISYVAYDQDTPLYKLNDFERLMSSEIKDDQLLMILKLGDDQERIRRLIANEHIRDTLFLKLLGMYKWSEESEEDSNEDRGVVMATLRRFLDYKPNEEDLLYSSLTLKRLAVDTKDPELLKALLRFPNYRFMQKGKQWIRLREVVATNPAIDEETVQKLLRFREERIFFYLAANPSLPLPQLKLLSDKNLAEVDEALASNPAIDDSLFAKLLDKGGDATEILLHYQPVDTIRFEMISQRDIAEDTYALLGGNQNLAPEVAAKLIEKSDNRDLIKALAANPAVPEEILETLFNRSKEDLLPYLAGNRTLPSNLLETIYNGNRNAPDILLALAGNAATPESILRELFKLDRFEINEALAANESLPLELLNILKIDTRLRNALTSNKTFTDNITRTLGL